MAKYHLTNKAVEDLNNIWLYTFDNWSEKQADSYYNDLVAAFQNIAEKPVSLDREYPEIRQGLYAHHCRKHLVFYQLIEDEEVEIIRILYERMDIETKF